MSLAILIAVFGAFGAVSRYFVSLYFSQTQFPLGTLSVNLLGSVLIGVLFALRQNHVVLGSEAVHMAVIVGFLGAFTTFSAFSMESVNLLNSGAYTYFSLNILLNVALCLLGTFLGHKFTSILI